VLLNKEFKKEILKKTQFLKEERGI